MEPFRQFLKSLNAAGVEFVVVGGHAVMFHGYPRSTDDLDLLFLQSKSNSQRLTVSVGQFVPGVSPADFLGPVDELLVVRTHGVRVDLLPEISGVETEEALATAVNAELFGEPVLFISRSLLLKNKRSTLRLKDKADAEELDGPER